MRLVNNASIPLYAATFLENDTLVVAGGGGQGAHGIANKVIVYRLDYNGTEIAKVTELEFPNGSDCPTCIATASPNSLWVGINTPTKETKVNNAVELVLKDSTALTTRATLDHLNTTDYSVYLKSINISSTTLISTSSTDPGTVSILRTDDAPGPKITTLKFDGELIGSAVSSDWLVIATESRIEVRSLADPHAAAVASLPAAKLENWSRVAYLGDNKFVAAATLGARKGAGITVFEVSKGKLSQRSSKIPGFKGVTALAAAADRAGRVAVASPSGDVVVYDISELEVPAKPWLSFKAVHKFPVTALSISDNGDTVASTSLDGSFVVHTNLNSQRNSSLKATVGWVTLSAIIIALLALVVSSFIDLNSVHHHIENNAKVVIGSLNRRSGIMGHGPVVQSLSYGSTPSESVTQAQPSEVKPTDESVNIHAANNADDSAASPPDEATISNKAASEATPAGGIETMPDAAQATFAEGVVNPEAMPLL